MRGWKLRPAKAGSNQLPAVRGYDPLMLSDREIRRLLREHASSIWIQSTPEEIDRYWNDLGEEELREIDADLLFASEHLEILELSGVAVVPREAQEDRVFVSAYQGQTARTPNASPVVARFGFGTALLIGFGAVSVAVAAGLIVYLLISGQTFDVELRDHTW